MKTAAILMIFFSLMMAALSVEGADLSPKPEFGAESVLLLGASLVGLFGIGNARSRETNHKGEDNMSKIAVIITDMFEDVEYTGPAEGFKGAGHELVHVGIKKGETVKGKKASTPVTIDAAVSEVSADQFDALLIPGGFSPDKLRADEKAVDFVRNFVKSDKPVFSICHGPQLLITADVLQGRTVTGWKSIVQDIKNAGATFVDQEVVEDGNLVSSRNPNDVPAFTKAALARL